MFFMSAMLSWPDSSPDTFFCFDGPLPRDIEHTVHLEAISPMALNLVWMESYVHTIRSLQCMLHPNLDTHYNTDVVGHAYDDACPHGRRGRGVKWGEFLSQCLAYLQISETGCTCSAIFLSRGKVASTAKKRRGDSGR